MRAIALEIVVILVLVLANGVFALSEFALVSVRRVRLEKRAREGDRRARKALELLADPSGFLSTVQVGITLIGILAGAFGGATLAEELAARLAGVRWIGAHAETVALGLVVLGITYLSLVVGELAPKRIALANAEAITRAIAPTMRLVAVVARPAVWLLSVSTDGLLRLFGARPVAEPPVTEEEIRLLMRKGAESGTVDPSERAMAERIFRLGDLPVGAVMTPRKDVVWLDVADTARTILEKVEGSRRSRFPVARGSLDHLVGVVSAKDLLVRALGGSALDLAALVRPALFVPEGKPALRVLEDLRSAAPHLAIVIDERGDVQGVVTVNTIIEAVIGEMATGGVAAAPLVVRREDGSLSVDGMLGFDELREQANLPEPPPDERFSYHTVAGFVLVRLGRIPAVGERFDWGGYRFEILDMDEQRIDRVLISRAPPTLAA